MTSSGGQDERQRQRILQLRQHVKQAEDAAISLKDDLEALGEIPSHELAGHAERKSDWDAARDANAAAAADLDNAKAEANKDMLQLQAELASSAQKRERLTTRITKIHEQHDRLQNEQTANLSARQRHEQERAKILGDRRDHDNKMIYFVNQMNREAEENNIKANQMHQQTDYANYQLARRQESISRAPTPEGNLPGTNGHAQRSAQSYDFQSFMLPQTQVMNPSPWGGGGGRGRSSSMLSAYSGFTDDQDLPSYVPDEQQRKRSDGSPVSAGSGQVGEHLSSPRPSGKMVTPIGPPSSADDRAKARGMKTMRGGSNW